MKVTLLKAPTEEELLWCKDCALGTVGLNAKTVPTDEWLHSIADAEHSPIRELVFHYKLEDIPYWVSNELCRHHEGVEKYVKSQRNDRQTEYDRAAARQDAPVNIRVSINAQALMNIAHRRLCGSATKEMQTLTGLMCRQAEDKCPWLKGLLVPMCEYRGGKCHEIKCCGRNPWVREKIGKPMDTVKVSGAVLEDMTKKLENAGRMLGILPEGLAWDASVIIKEVIGDLNRMTEE